MEESLYRFQIDTDDDFSSQSDDVAAPSNKKRDSSRPATFVWPSKPNPFLPADSTDFRDFTRPTQQIHTRLVNFADATQAKLEHPASQAYVHFSAKEVGRLTRSDVAEPRSYESAHTFPMKADTSVSTVLHVPDKQLNVNMQLLIGLTMIRLLPQADPETSQLLKNVTSKVLAISNALLVDKVTTLGEVIPIG